MVRQKVLMHQFCSPVGFAVLF